MAIPCRHDPAGGFEGCRYCALWRDNPALRKSWGGTPDPQPGERVEPCVRLGPPTGETVQAGCCGGRTRLKLHSCGVHGVCVLDKPDGGVMGCGWCPDYTTATERVRAEVIEAVPDMAIECKTAEYRDEFQRRAKLHAEPPGHFAGRGIVSCAGGDKFFACFWVQLRMLRHLGCALPVEVWHLGRSEMDPEMRLLLEAEGVTVVDAFEVIKQLPVPPRRLNGWELKPFAVIHSRFAEVLFLDADCVPVIDPSGLFDDAGYQRHGAIFWPDLPPHDRAEWMPPVVWSNCGMAYRDEPDFESGQFLVDKRRCWDALQLCMWLNEHSDYFYKFVFGDKSTFHLAWRGVGRDYAMPRACDWIYPAILQYSPSGQVMFVHNCQGKEFLAECRLLPDGIPSREKLQDAGRTLRQVWRGRVWDWVDQTQEEHRLAQSVPGRYWYRRECDKDGRAMTLLPGGEIGDGKASCEKRWTLRLLGGTPTLVITGEAHKGTELGMMFLTQDAEGVWRGKWEAHERCGVAMTPMVPRTPPAGWLTRPGTWDRDIWDTVVRDNEYGLPAAFAPGDVVIDVGAHTGSFALACLLRGAAKVVCVEPHPENYKLLWGNLAPWRDRIEARQRACWPRGGDVAMLDPLPGHANTGRWEIAEGRGVTAVRLDDLIDDAPGRVRLVKLDCEGAEWEILEEAGRLIGWVDEFVGEYHLKPGDGRSAEQLAATFRQHGLTCMSRATSEHTGLFRARRVADV